MTLARHHGGSVIVFTFIVALVLTIVPLPDGLAQVRPDWVGLVLIYWCLALPDRVSVGYGFMLGLLTDVLTGTLLGFTINAAGSPETNKIVVRGAYDLKKRVEIAKEISGLASPVDS